MAVTAIIAGTVTGTAVWMRRGAPAQPQGLTRFPVALDESLSFASNGLPLIGISSDGSRLAYAALSRDEPTQVTQRFYIRSMSETSSKPLSGSEVRGGTVGAPVFSPDNQSIVYYTGSSGTGVYDRMRGALKRISVGGGNPETVAADVLLPMGLSWDRDTDTIVFGQPSKGILRVNARGGEPQQIISIQEGELTQGPQMLPGGDAVLFTLAQGAPAGSLGPVESTWDKADIVVQSIASGQRKTVIHGGSDARYISSGHIVYAVAGTLRAVAFDVKRLEAVGQPTLVLEGVGRARFGPVTRTGSAHVSVSASGSLVYLPGPAAPTGSLQNVAYINRNGAFESLKLTPANYEYPRISPDGKRVAVGIDDGKEANIWTYDLSRTNAIRQLTFGGGRNRFPVWSADGQYVAFQSDRDGDRAIFWQRADGMAQAVRLTRPEAGVTHVPDSWSPKNDQLLIDVQSTSGFSLAMLNVRDGKIASFEGVQSRSISPAAVFSPEGRWVAYQSGEIPVPRIFVKPASGLGPALPVVDGRSPRYSADGKQIYFTRADRMMAVEFRTEPTFSVGNPVVINQNAATGGGPIERAAQTSPSTPMTVLPRAWDLTSDGRFIGIIDEVPASTSSARHIDVVLGWFTELNQRVPLQ
jgi:Tol biopolymer transport system component